MTKQLNSQIERCSLDPDDPLFVAYHDQEWGVPTFDDQRFFEKICLEGFQAGLSWKHILHRREALRAAFDNFSAITVARYNEHDVARLMQDKRIIRNRRKIVSVINNAQRMLDLQDEAISLAVLCWSFAPASAQRPSRLTRQWLIDNPSTPESTALANELKRRGWSYVGPVNMYALMQAHGLVNDHVYGCPRRDAIESLKNIYRS